MFPAALVFALGGTLLIADGVPALNVEPGCRAAAKMGDSLSLDTSWKNSGRNFPRPFASVVLPPLKRADLPATSKFSCACRWGATRRRWKRLWVAVGKAIEMTQTIHVIVI